MPTISAQISDMLQLMQQCFENETLRNYEELNRQFNQVETTARETYQAALRNDYEGLVQKLENGGSLTPAEQETLRLLIVGSADFYLQSEDDFQAWKDELQRLAQEIGAMQAAGLTTVGDLMRLQALCREAKRVLPDVLYYLREQRRVRRFETSMQEPLNPENARHLAVFLREIMSSDRM